MKKYKKTKSKKGKLLQVRLSDKEYEQVKEFINKFETTHREWLLATVNHLREATLLVNGLFYENWKDHAYSNSDRWNKSLNEDSVCEECGKKMSYDERGHSELQRHHYLGYVGDNGLKVQILCRKCHGPKKKSIDKIDCDICKNTRVYDGKTCQCTGSVTNLGLY